MIIFFVSVYDINVEWESPRERVQMNGEGSARDECGSMNYVYAETAVLHLGTAVYTIYRCCFAVRLIKIVSFIFAKVVAFLTICFAYLNMIITQRQPQILREIEHNFVG